MTDKLNSLKIISRASNLALKQVEEVMQNFSELNYSVLPLECFGDKHKDIPLLVDTNSCGGDLLQNIPTPSDFFTREIDETLLSGEGDIAIHSAKDLPYPLPDNLEILALTKSTDQTDALVSLDYKTLNEMPNNSRIGTSSPTRRDQILAHRPDLKIVAIRGTIEERLALVDSGVVDALIVATCALKRLGLENRISEVLAFKTHPLQGCLAVVGRRDALQCVSTLRTTFPQIDIRTNWGTVYIIGAGPGDPELITVKGQRILEEVDVVFHDDLVDINPIRNCRDAKYCVSPRSNKNNPELIYVGKRKNNHSNSQDEINEMMYQSAITGKTVARLKGGDPFIFGRGGEEMDYLAQRLINVEIISGITAASAAASYSGIPLTERGKSSSVALLTGHPEEKITVPETDTLVYYMAGTKLATVAKKVVEAGRSPDTPVAIISNASKPDQQVQITTLKELVPPFENGKFPHPPFGHPLPEGEGTSANPSLIIIGETARNKTTQSWFARKKKVLVTGTNPEPYRRLGKIIHQPLIELAPLIDYTEADTVLSKILDYDWLIFTSKYTVKYFFERLIELNLDARSLANCQIASIGKKTSQVLQEHGLTPDFQAEDETSAGLIEAFRCLVNFKQKILIPRSNIALPILPEGLRKLAFDVRALTIYQNTKPANIKPIDLSLIDIVVFTSPSTVRNFKEVYGELPKHIQPIMAGPETEKAYVLQKI